MFYQPVRPLSFLLSYVPVNFRNPPCFFFFFEIEVRVNYFSERSTDCWNVVDTCHTGSRFSPDPWSNPRSTRSSKLGPAPSSFRSCFSRRRAEEKGKGENSCLVPDRGGCCVYRHVYKVENTLRGRERARARSWHGGEGEWGMEMESGGEKLLRCRPSRVRG